jgi:methylthioribulose-1-phosphate dehydratase
MAARERGAGSVVHSHALSAVLAGDLAAVDGSDHVAIRDLEMLKGIRGVGNRDTHLLPVIRNTPREAELTEQLARVLADPRFASSFAVVVADHGAYIWGDDIWEAKRHTEVYHFLFEAVVARRDRRQEPDP